MERITSFTDLNAWQSAKKVAVTVYKVTTTFPIEEKFGIVNQLRRASVSISSNIAEGFSRQSSKEKMQFYFIAKGSLSEVENQLLVAEALGFISTEAIKDVKIQLTVTGRLLTGLIKSVQTRG